MNSVHSVGSLVFRPKQSHRSILPTLYTRRMNNPARKGKGCGTKEKRRVTDRITRHDGVAVKKIGDERAGQRIGREGRKKRVHDLCRSGRVGR